MKKMETFDIIVNFQGTKRTAGALSWIHSSDIGAVKGKPRRVRVIGLCASRIQVCSGLMSLLDPLSSAQMTPTTLDRTTTRQTRAVLLVNSQVLEEFQQGVRHQITMGQTDHSYPASSSTMRLSRLGLLTWKILIPSLRNLKMINAALTARQEPPHP